MYFEIWDRTEKEEEKSNIQTQGQNSFFCKRKKTTKQKQCLKKSNSHSMNKIVLK